MTHERYLELAEQAEAKAAKAITEAIRESWLTIARCYRDLAKGLPVKDNRAPRS